MWSIIYALITIRVVTMMPQWCEQRTIVEVEHRQANHSQLIKDWQANHERLAQSQIKYQSKSGLVSALAKYKKMYKNGEFSRSSWLFLMISTWLLVQKLLSHLPLLSTPLPPTHGGKTTGEINNILVLMEWTRNCISLHHHNVMQDYIYALYCL